MLSMRIKTQSHEIPFYVGQNLWETLSSYLQNNFPAHSIFVICDSNIANRYTATAEQYLKAHPFFREILVFPAGEQYKSRDQKDRLEDLLLLAKAGRDSVIIAMGGGVTGDLAGYVAATLLRGVPLIHLPTSLLAQVDSSIGGKVGINHATGKNLIGAFYQPQAVFCDVDFLNSLPNEEFYNGMAEVIKYAVILDEELWHWLETESDQILQRNVDVLKKIITRCIKLKINVVEADEKETGYRSILNFGHTVGHAIEKLTVYQVKHGFAIAAGMKIAAALSEKHLNYPPGYVKRLWQLIDRFQLNRVQPNQFSIDELWQCMVSDKKARRQIPRFTLMKSPKEPELFYPIEKQELENALTSQ